MKQETKTPESLFTGGEWKVDKDKPTIVRLNEWARVEQVVELENCGSLKKYDNFTKWGEAEANALLISEAKNMLDIVKQVNFYFSNEANYPEGTIGYLMGQTAKEILSRINKQQ